MVLLVVMEQQNQVIGVQGILYHANITNLALANWVTSADFHIQRFVSLGASFVIDSILGASINVLMFTSNGDISSLNNSFTYYIFLLLHTLLTALSIRNIHSPIITIITLCL
jgi:hypothetical protein